jgi:hypothetical protein
MMSIKAAPRTSLMLKTHFGWMHSLPNQFTVTQTSATGNVNIPSPQLSLSTSLHFFLSLSHHLSIYLPFTFSHLCSVGTQGCRSRGRSPGTWERQLACPVRSHRWWPLLAGAASETGASWLSSDSHHNWGRKWRTLWLTLSRGSSGDNNYSV